MEKITSLRQKKHPAPTTVITIMTAVRIGTLEKVAIKSMPQMTDVYSINIKKKPFIRSTTLLLIAVIPINTVFSADDSVPIGAQ